MRKAPLLLVLAVGCHQAAHSAVAAPSSPEPALPVVHVLPDAGPYLFSYYGADGKLRDVSSMGDIPADARRQVIVRDLSRSPADLHTDEYLYLVDLHKPMPEDGYTASVVSRYSFEAEGDVALGPSDTTEAPDGGGERQVIVYGTSWCGACKAARSHLKERHIPFVEKDIEKDQAAAQELARKAKRAGLKLGGVPVIDVGGQLMMGYDPGALDRAWASIQ